MGEAGKHLLFECVQAGCHVVLRGRRGTLWHSNLFDNVSKISSLEEVSNEMLVFLRTRVSSRVSGFPVASPCQWGKLENLTFSNVPKQVVILFTLYTFTLLTPHFTLHTPLHSSLHTPHFTLSISRSLLYNSALHTPHFPLHTPHSTLYTPHSTLYTLG